MDIRIKTNDHHQTPTTADYLATRLASLEKLLGEDAHHSRVEVEIGRDAGRPRHGDNIWFAEMQIIVPGAERIVARNNSESVNGAIDDVKEEIERQLRRERKLHIRLYRRSGALAKRLLRFGNK